MRSEAFWQFFNTQAAPNLGLREQTFRRMFEYLDARPGAIRIVETGCARQAGNWAGDGQSTVLFDKYISCRDQDSTCFTVDISLASVTECRKLVSSRVEVTQEDSVSYLWRLSTELSASGQTIDLLYLDSFDLDSVHWVPSAIHHLKELTAVIRSIDEDTLVVVDDCPQTGHFVLGDANTVQFIAKPSVGGKGRLIAEFAEACGAELRFAHYQAGWTGF